MNKHIKYSKTTSWTTIQNDLFVFENLYDQAFIFRGLRKELWFLIQKHPIITDAISVLKQLGYEEDALEKKVNMLITEFEEKNLVIVRSI